MSDKTPLAGDGLPMRSSPPSARQGWLQNRREKAIAEIQRNRRGEYTVPTWVLTGALVAILAAWAAIIVFA